MKFIEVEKKINQNDLISFENEYKVALPENYKNLLLKYNGGLTEDSHYFDTLLSIKYGELKVEDIINLHQILEKNIPKNYLPIALDFAGNCLTINLENGTNYGKIVCFYFDVDKTEIIADSLEKLFSVDSINEL